MILWRDLIRLYVTELFQRPPWCVNDTMIFSLSSPSFCHAILQELLPLVLSFELPAIMQSDPSSPTVQHISQTYNLTVSFKPPTRLYRATGVVRGSQNNANAVKVRRVWWFGSEKWLGVKRGVHRNVIISRRKCKCKYIILYCRVILNNTIKLNHNIFFHLLPSKWNLPWN